MKDNAYQKHLATVFNLMNSILRHIQNIHANALRLVVESAIFRMECVVEQDDSHTEHVLKFRFAY